jgi:hypothetical protein
MIETVLHPKSLRTKIGLQHYLFFHLYIAITKSVFENRFGEFANIF